MKVLLAFFAFNLVQFVHGQSLEELQGKWLFVKISYKGADAEFMKEDGPSNSCLKMNTMEFKDREVTMTLFFDKDCKESESETFEYQIKGNNLKFWSDYAQDWDTAKIKRFSKERFVLESKDDDLITAITLKKVTP